MPSSKAREDVTFGAHEVRENGASEFIHKNDHIASATKNRRDRNAHDVSVNHVERETGGAGGRHAMRAVSRVDMRSGRFGRSAVSTRTRALARGDIRLVRAAWLLSQPAHYRIQYRQQLEELERQGVQPTPLLSPAEAVALVRMCRRGAGALTYGWLSAGALSA